MFNINDVDRYKKGLSDEQKKRFCVIANDIYNRTSGNGETEKERRLSAIKQANKAVGKPENKQQMELL